MVLAVYDKAFKETKVHIEEMELGLKKSEVNRRAKVVVEVQEAEYIGHTKDKAEAQRLEVQQPAEEAMHQTMENEAAEQVTGKVAKAMEREPAFTIKLQSNMAPTQEVVCAVLMWLLMHTLVVLDPSDHWVVSRIVAVLTHFDLKELQCRGLLVELNFAFHVMHVSGYKWNHYRFKPPEVPL